jgi:hypothetical protein
MNKSWYHVAPMRLRNEIASNGLKASFGGGFFAGSSPLQKTEAPLVGVYLAKEPGNVGFAKTVLVLEPCDIWQVSLDEKHELRADCPALVEWGAYVEEEGIYFDNDTGDVLHTMFGELITWQDISEYPESFIELTRTACSATDIPPECLTLSGPYR